MWSGGGAGPRRADCGWPAGADSARRAQGVPQAAAEKGQRETRAAACGLAPGRACCSPAAARCDVRAGRARAHAHARARLAPRRARCLLPVHASSSRANAPCPPPRRAQVRDLGARLTIAKQTMVCLLLLLPVCPCTPWTLPIRDGAHVRLSELKRSSLTHVYEGDCSIVRCLTAACVHCRRGHGDSWHFFAAKCRPWRPKHRRP